MTKDIPAGVIAVGNPCKVKRKITDKDMFDTVQELLEANSKVVQKNPSHCLVGKLFCESCKQRMAHSYRGRPKYYCKTRYYESDNTGCVTSVLDETLEQIVIDEFNHIQENRIDAQKIFQEQEAQRMLRINQYEDKIRELHVIKNSYDSKVMAYYEAYREGTMSQQEYLDGRDSYILLQAKVDQDINDANEKLKELRREEVIGLEVFSFEGKFRGLSGKIESIINNWRKIKMKISKIRIKNYRGIKNSGWIEFDRLNAIVGKNDAGKSSILHAINDFYNESKLAEGNKYFGAGDEETEIEICFYGEELITVPKVILDENGYLHIKKTSSNVGESYKTYIIANDFGKADYKNMFQQTAAKMKTIFKTFGKEVPDIINKEKMLELCSEIICSEESYVIEEHELKGSMLKEIIKPLYPQFSLFLADTNLDTSTSSFQNQFKKIVTNAIQAHISEFSNLQNEVQETLIGEINKIGNYMETHYSGLTELKPEISYDWQKLVNFEVIMKDSQGYEVNLANKGTGIQRLFMVSYFQYLAEQISENENSYIFVIEEPETFLHPGAQRTLLDSLKRISDIHQVIITTHSPVFASEIDNKNIIVAKKHNGESKYEQGDSISADLLVNELGVRASDNIVNSKLLVFVEGSNDVKFWDFIFNAVSGHSYEEDGILFVPGGGNELHNIAEMNLMSKLNRNFIVIVDKDSGAVDYEDKLRKQSRLKNTVEQKGGEVLVLRKREIENYYSPRIVKEILSEKGFEVGDFEISPFEDVNQKFKNMFNGQNIQMKFKNNMDIFERMTLDDWKSVSKYTEDNIEHFEFGEIVELINSKID